MAATPNLDMALDDMISSKPKPGRRGSSNRNSAKRNIVGNSRPSSLSNSPRPSASLLAAEKPATTAPTGKKILISNLPPDVAESDVTDLFTSTVGPVKECQINYDSAGRSKGTATVFFQRGGDAAEAFSQYNNRLIDGKRTLRIEIVVDPARTAPPSLAQRVGEAREPRAPREGGISEARPPRRDDRGGRGRGGRGGRGSGGGGGGERRARNERPKKTAEDLDAEMADYVASAETTA